jgi:hypothetical protein
VNLSERNYADANGIPCWPCATPWPARTARATNRRDWPAMRRTRLGFTIIRSLCALMGYQIKVSSKIGEVFASSLPV